jgi:hypothetical protein
VAGIELFAGPTVPRVSSRQRRCREKVVFVLRASALGKSCESGSVDYPNDLFRSSIFGT